MTELPPERTTLSRRRFLSTVGVGIAGGAALGTAAAVGGVAASKAGTDAESVVGVIEELVTPTSLRIRRDDGSVSVALAKDARVWRDHAVSLDAFGVGEDVVAEGKWQDGVFEALSLTNVIVPLEGRVLEVGSGHLRTTRGVVEFVSETRLQRPSGQVRVSPSDFKVGRTVQVWGRRDPRTKRIVALRVV